MLVCCASNPCSCNTPRAHAYASYPPLCPRVHSHPGTPLGRGAVSTSTAPSPAQPVGPTPRLPAAEAAAAGGGLDHVGEAAAAGAAPSWSPPESGRAVSGGEQHSGGQPLITAETACPSGGGDSPALPSVAKSPRLMNLGKVAVKAAKFAKAENGPVTSPVGDAYVQSGRTAAGDGAGRGAAAAAPGGRRALPTPERLRRRDVAEAAGMSPGGASIGSAHLEEERQAAAPMDIAAPPVTGNGAPAGKQAPARGGGKAGPKPRPDLRGALPPGRPPAAPGKKQLDGGLAKAGGQKRKAASGGRHDKQKQTRRELFPPSPSGELAARRRSGAFASTSGREERAAAAAPVAAALRNAEKPRKRRVVAAVAAVAANVAATAGGVPVAAPTAAAVAAGGASAAQPIAATPADAVKAVADDGRKPGYGRRKLDAALAAVAANPAPAAGAASMAAASAPEIPDKTAFDTVKATAEDSCRYILHLSPFGKAEPEGGDEHYERFLSILPPHPGVIPDARGWPGWVPGMHHEPDGRKVPTPLRALLLRRLGTKAENLSGAALDRALCALVKIDDLGRRLPGGILEIRAQTDSSADKSIEEEQASPEDSRAWESFVLSVRSDFHLPRPCAPDTEAVSCQLRTALRPRFLSRSFLMSLDRLQDKAAGEWWFSLRRSSHERARAGLDLRHRKNTRKVSPHLSSSSSLVMRMVVPVVSFLTLPHAPAALHWRVASAHGARPRTVASGAPTDQKLRRGTRRADAEASASFALPAWAGPYTMTLRRL